MRPRRTPSAEPARARPSRHARPTGSRRPGGARWVCRTAALAAAATFGLGACTSDGYSGNDPSSRVAAMAPAATVTAEPERDVVIDGRTFKARCAGDGPAVLVVADYARSMDDIWAEIPEPLAAQSRVCAYDRLGVGRSDPAPDRQTLASMADDLGGVITALGMKRPIVVGHALGGAIVLTWASARAADARALVLLDPMPPGYFGPGRALKKALPARDPGDLDLSNLWADIDAVSYTHLTLPTN